MACHHGEDAGTCGRHPPGALSLQTFTSQNGSRGSCRLPSHKLPTNAAPAPYSDEEGTMMHDLTPSLPRDFEFATCQSCNWQATVPNQHSKIAPSFRSGHDRTVSNVQEKCPNPQARLSATQLGNSWPPHRPRPRPHQRPRCKRTRSSASNMTRPWVLHTTLCRP